MPRDLNDVPRRLDAMHSPLPARVANALAINRIVYDRGKRPVNLEAQVARTRRRYGNARIVVVR